MHVPTAPWKRHELRSLQRLRCRWGSVTTLLLVTAVAAALSPAGPVYAQPCMIDADCDDGNPCTLDTCDLTLTCQHDAAARDGFACDDHDPCTITDVCSGGNCGGSIGGDTDGDGYCDQFEQQLGCDPTDGAEIPPQAATFSGTAGGAPANVLMTYASPTNRKVFVASDPSCAMQGVCGPLGFCTAGKIADPCVASSDCNQPANTCRVVINYAAIPDLTLKAAEFNHVPIPGFTPLHPGCSRKVDVAIDPTRKSNRLVLMKALGTAGGRKRRDTDMFRYLK